MGGLFYNRTEICLDLKWNIIAGLHICDNVFYDLEEGKENWNMIEFEKLNDLAPEAKILLVTAQVTLEEARGKMKEKGLGLDLTSRWQLRDDCAELERCMKKIAKGKYKEKDMEKLRLATIRLQTVVEGVFRGK